MTTRRRKIQQQRCQIWIKATLARWSVVLVGIEHDVLESFPFASFSSKVIATRKVNTTSDLRWVRESSCGHVIKPPHFIGQMCTNILWTYSYFLHHKFLQVSFCCPCRSEHPHPICLGFFVLWKISKWQIPICLDWKPKYHGKCPELD